MTEEKKEELFKAAAEIKKICKENGETCTGCPLWEKSKKFHGCPFADSLPEGWEI